jgi:hypothetical protein
MIDTLYGSDSACGSASATFRYIESVRASTCASYEDTCFLNTNGDYEDVVCADTLSGITWQDYGYKISVYADVEGSAIGTCTGSPALVIWTQNEDCLDIQYSVADARQGMESVDVDYGYNEELLFTLYDDYDCSSWIYEWDFYGYPDICYEYGTSGNVYTIEYLEPIVWFVETIYINDACHSGWANETLSEVAYKMVSHRCEDILIPYDGCGEYNYYYSTYECLATESDIVWPAGGVVAQFYSNDCDGDMFYKLWVAEDCTDYTDNAVVPDVRSLQGTCGSVNADYEIYGCDGVDDCSCSVTMFDYVVAAGETCTTPLYDYAPYGYDIQCPELPSSPAGIALPSVLLILALLILW